MSKPTKTFSLGTPESAQSVWSCVQTTSVNKDHTVYTPPPPSYEGTCSTPAAGGHVDLDFNVDLSAATVTYELTHAPFIVPTDKVWDGIQDMINGCQQQNS